MLKRIAVAAMAALMAVMIMAPSVLAAPAPSAQPVINWNRAPWQARWQPFPVWPGWGQAPARGTGLQYKLDYSSETNELVLLVYNPTKKPITVSTPNGMTTDFVLWKDGSVAYRANYGKSFAQAQVKETFRPGQGKLYKETLPNSLRQGTYMAQAYFIGETKWQSVASTYVTLKARAAHDPLEYKVEYMDPSWFNSSPRLRVTIKNTSDKDITLPYQYGYQVLVKKPGDTDYRGDVGIGQSIGTIETGASRYIFVPLNGLEPGQYQVDVRSNVGSGYYRIVAQTWFYTR